MDNQGAGTDSQGASKMHGWEGLVRWMARRLVGWIVRGLVGWIVRG